MLVALELPMDCRRYHPEESAAIVSLFTSVFTKSEGVSAGKLIEQLTKDLLEKTVDSDRDCLVAVDGGLIVGVIVFSRLAFENAKEAFILSSVAVHSDRQGQGIGQALINYGLAELQHQNVSLVLTYGDPAFYSKVGFQAISPTQIIPPFPLSQPEGWLGQSLTSAAIATVSGEVTCVEALNDPQYW